MRFVFVLSSLLLAANASASTITVTTTSQHGPGCTLSDAIIAANVDQPFGDCPTGQGADTIHLPAGDYVLATPAVVDGNDITGLPYVTRPITITGAGAGLTIIRRDPQAPVFRLLKVEAPFTIRDLTLAGGDAGGREGGAISAETFNTANLPSGNARMVVSVRNVTFNDNRGQSGGALSDAGFYFGPFVEFNVEDAAFAGNTSIDGGGAIEASPGAAVLVRRSSFSDNTTGAWGGAIHASHDGGLIDVSDTEFLRNRSLNQTGGAIDAWDVRLTRVTMRDNSARDAGGAVYSYDGLAEITDSTFTGNSARRGGAVDSLGQLRVAGSTFAANSATLSHGGAIFLDDRTAASRVTNSTFSANTAVERGGAVGLFQGGLTVVNATVTGNAAGYGPGFALFWNGNAALRVSNSIIAGNARPDGLAVDVQFDPSEQVVSLGHNVIGSDEFTAGAFTAAGDHVGTAAHPLDAALLPLADNGGPTPTHALSSVSPAVDGGSPAAPGTDDACEATDQRGAPRPDPGSPRCDAGAYEGAVALQQQLDLAWTAGGTITDEAGGPLCASSPCSLTYDEGTVVTMIAQPDAGMAFAGWAGDCAGAAASCTIVMSSARSLSAAFSPATDRTSLTTLTASANPSVNGQEVTFTVTVSAAAPPMTVPAGDVTFLDAADAVLGMAPLDGTGTASMTLRLGAGSHQIRASYSGDSTFAPGSASMTQVVSAATTAIALTSSASPSPSGEAVTFTASVSTLAPGSGTPSGAVTFVHGPANVVLETVPLDPGGTAAVTSTTLPEGTYAVQAIYAGSGAFNGSTATITQAVAPAPETPIRNGDPESRPEFGAVGMILPGPGHAACTAMMISRFVVLTAAQCVRDVTADPVFDFSPGPGRVARVTDIRVHPGFEPGNGEGLNLAFDVALLQIDEAAAGAWTDIVPMTLQDGAIALGVHATAVGFGNGARTSGDLLVNDFLAGEGPVGVPIPDAFIEIMPGDSKNQMFCRAGIGGPLTSGGQIAGIASFRFVETCAEPGPGYYVSVGRLADWIRTTAAGFERVSLTVSWTAGGAVVDEAGVPLCEAAPGAAASCAVEFPKGAVVRLSARPVDGAALQTWSGDCHLRLACVVTLDAPKTAHAAFGYPLTVTRTGGTSTSFVLINGSMPFECLSGASTCTAIVAAGSVTLAASAIAPTRFVRWENPSPCVTPTNATCTFTIAGPTTVTARFTGSGPLPDRTGPVISVAHTTIEVTSGLSAPVSAAGATAVDAVDGPVPVTCSVIGPFGGSYSLQVGSNRLDCVALDNAEPPNTTRSTFYVSVVAPLAQAQADALVKATTSTPGASTQMIHAAERVQLLLTPTTSRSQRQFISLVYGGVCANLEDFIADVTKAAQRRRITSAGAQALIAAAQALSATAGCAP